MIRRWRQQAGQRRTEGGTIAGATKPAGGAEPDRPTGEDARGPVPVNAGKFPAAVDGSTWNSPGERRSEPASRVSSETPINILIVDDEPKNLTVLETVLADSGYRLIRAESADQALLALVAEEFALLILDIRMPGMNGFELAHTIKARKKTSRVPIIFLTAYYNEDQHVLEGYDTGAVDYIHKPVNAAILRSKVAIFAELHRKHCDVEMANRALVAEVTERRRAEEQLRQLNETLDVRVMERTEALRESEERFRTLAEGMPHFVWICDAAGSIEYQNSAWYEYTGMSSGTGHGLDWLDCYHPEDRPKLMEEWRLALLSDGSRQYDVAVRIRRWDAEYRWFRVKGSPIKGAEGATARWAGTCSDIHEERLLLDALVDADRRKDEFLATLAHELRNPLAPVRNAVQLLQMKGPAIPELQWAREVIDRQTQHLTRLIDDLMDVSRISRGRIELKREHIELVKVVQGAIETSRPLIEESGHELTVTLPSGPVIVDGDLTRLTQVFLNLLNNAAKYTERAGRIDLRAELQNGEVVVSVRDTGIGIATDKLPTLFEMFSQVEGALSRSRGGLGIGLFLAKRLVQMHGGTIEAHSDGRNKGSDFVVRLPIVAEHTFAQRRSDDGTQEAPASGLRILVVDDNQDAALMLTRVLETMGHHLKTVYDGQAVVAAAREFKPDLVLCDIGMPKMNGYEACRRIRQESWGKNMILVAVTGWGREGDRRQAEEAGFDRHLVKPVEPEVLMRMLAELKVGKASSQPTT